MNEVTTGDQITNELPQNEHLSVNELAMNA